MSVHGIGVLRCTTQADWDAWRERGRQLREEQEAKDARWKAKRAEDERAWKAAEAERRAKVARQQAEAIQAERQHQAEVAAVAQRRAFEEAEQRAARACQYELGSFQCRANRGKHPRFCVSHRPRVAARRVPVKVQRTKALPRGCQWSTLARWDAERYSEGVVDPSHEYSINFSETDGDDAYYRDAIEPYTWR